MDSYDIIKSVHGLIGAIALITFWTSGFSKKGSPLHKASGKVYLLTMAAILLTAAPMTVAMAWTGKSVMAVFFGYLIVITSTSVWKSWRAIKDKRDWPRFTGPVYKFLMLLNGFSGLTILLIGLFLAKQSAGIYLAFSLIGLLSAFGMWRFSRTAPTDPRWWLKQHLGAMIGNGVATHIAFLSIGLPKLLPMLSGPILQNLAWLGPLVLAVIAGFYLNRKYLPTRTASVRDSVR